MKISRNTCGIIELKNKKYQKKRYFVLFETFAVTNDYSDTADHGIEAPTRGSSAKWSLGKQ